MRRLLLILSLALVTSAAWAQDLAPFSRGSMEKIRADHRGRALVVHVWSLTCAPCLAELPALAGKLAPAQADLVLVSTDSLDQAPRIKTALKRAGLTDHPAFAYADSFTERLNFEIDPNWAGELPFTLVIDAQGGTTSFSGMTEPQHLHHLMKH